ncbi:hypothetical protein CR513_01735, partial [Mucuna pruriens]
MENLIYLMKTMNMKIMVMKMKIKFILVLLHEKNLMLTVLYKWNNVANVSLTGTVKNRKGNSSSFQGKKNEINRFTIDFLRKTLENLRRDKASMDACFLLLFLF